MKRAATIVAIAGALMTGAAPAFADHDRGYGGGGYRAPEVRAGTLVIDGREFCIDARGNVRGQIVRAFRRCGYNAFQKDGCVFIRITCAEPRFHFRACEYGMTVSRNGDCLVLHVAQVSQYRQTRHVGPIAPAHKPVYTPVYRPQVIQKNYGHHDRRYRRDPGFNIHFNLGRSRYGSCSW